MGIVDKAKAKIAYEKGSWRLSQEELKRLKAEANQTSKKGGKR